MAARTEDLTRVGNDDTGSMASRLQGHHEVDGVAGWGTVPAGSTASPAQGRGRWRLIRKARLGLGMMTRRL
jgi:hypothetical protein